MHPFADSFIPDNFLDDSEPVFPLQLYLEPTTGYIQTGYLTDAEERYNLYPYSYTSSNSLFATDHWDELYEDILKEVGNPRYVTEIGCNDGYLLKKFQNSACDVLGIEASYAMCEVCTEKGLAVSYNIYGEGSPYPIQSDLIIANNVLNHSNNPFKFLKCVAANLIKDGTFVFEVPYWLSTHTSGHFDQIYHEHVSYFTVTSLRNLLSQAGLVITRCSIVNYHGGSLRVYAKKGKHTEDESVERFIKEEQKHQLFEVNTYVWWQAGLEAKRSSFLEAFYKRCHASDRKMVAVGAAAKANTFLNYYNLGHGVIDYITDSSPSKQGKYTPLTRIPIVSDDIFKELHRPYALILSWNIHSQLWQKILNINPQVEFIQI